VSFRFRTNPIFPVPNDILVGAKVGLVSVPRVRLPCSRESKSRIGDFAAHAAFCCIGKVVAPSAVVR
jgi:hypothetical protein